MKRFLLLFCTFLAVPIGLEAQTPSPPPVNSANMPSTRNEWMELHERYVETAKKGDIDLMFLGDSITVGWTNSKSGGSVWDKEFRPLKAAAFGIGGDRTENVLWRIQHGIFEVAKPRLVVLMIGTNNLAKNSAPQIAEAITTIIREIQNLSPQSKILLLGIFPRGEKPGNEERRKIEQINEVISKLDDGSRVIYRNIGASFLQSDGSLSLETSPDYLHLTTKGYQIWADAIRDQVHQLMETAET